MLELLYTSIRQITFQYGNPGFMGYVNSWDALTLVNYTRLDKVFRDGTQLNIGQAIYSQGGRQGGRYYYFNFSTSPVSCFGADEITGQPHTDDILNPTWPIPFELQRPGDFLDDRAGIFLHNLSAGIIRAYRLADGSQIGDISVPGGPWYDFLAPAGEGRVLACHKASGQVAFLDFFNRLVLWKSTVRPCICATYDLRHDLIITLETDRKIRVYLTIPVPASLAAPAFIPAVAHAHRLHGYQVQTRLTGGAGEVCPGYWIEWTLTGQPPKGYLEKPYSKTDQDGYAENFYFGPAAIGDTGQETLKVTVII